MARMPGAIWKPLASNWSSQPRMKAYDIFCLHTMVGTLSGSDGWFRSGNGAGYAGAESHFGVGPDGTIWQWQDTDFQADANVDGGWHVISSENADMGAPFPKWSGSDVPAFTPQQVEANARIAKWLNDTHGIPLDVIPDAKVGRRGIGWHRQGVPGYAVAGAERWSTSRGKVCPGDRRIGQVPAISARAKVLDGAGIVVGAPLAHPVIGAINAAYQRIVINRATWAYFLGFPLGPEVPTLDKAGRWQAFQRGSIYWHPLVDSGNAHVVWGAILERWRQIGSEFTTGFPTSDELSCPDGVGKMNHFAGDVYGPWSIYFHPKTGAHPVHGLFREFWGKQGWERGPLGYPTSAEYKNAAGLIQQNYQGGVLRLVNGKVEVHPL